MRGITDLTDSTYLTINMKKLLILFLLTPLLSFSQVKTIWKDARFLAEPVKKIMVFSQFYETEVRNEAETSMINALLARGIGAVKASDVFVYDSMYLYSTMERKLDSCDADGIMVIKMVEERSTDMYIMPEELIPPFAYNYYEYYSFYYYHDFPIIMDPNYYRKPGRTFRIDVYLYQNKGDMVIWGGQTKPVNPLEPQKVIGKLGKSVAKQIMKEGVVLAE